MARDSWKTCSVLLGLMLWTVPMGSWCAKSVEAGYGRNRLLHAFDFEERDFGDSMPMHWYAIGRQAKNSDPNFHHLRLHEELVKQYGFPAFTEVRFDTTQQTSGQHSLYLGLDGGSAGAFLEVGSLPAVPDSDYLITAQVLTGPLEHARARLVAYFVDSVGNRVDASVRATDPIQTHGQWQQVAVKLLGDHPNAAWIGIQLELLQPEPQPDSPLGRFQVVLNEVKGSAWFDDVAIWLTPRVVVRTQSRVNIVRAPAKPELWIDVRDLTGEAMTAKVGIYDHRRNPVGQIERRIGGRGPTTWRWEPPLKQFGWYVVDLTVYESGAAASKQPIAQSLTSLLWLPGDAPLDPTDSSRFTISATDVSQKQLKHLPQVLDQSGLASVIISAWDRNTTAENIDQRQAVLDEVTQPMLSRGQRVALSLSPVPTTLAQELDIDADSALWLFAHPKDRWRPYIAPVIIRHGQRVHRWYAGEPSTPVMLPTLSDLVRTTIRSLRDMAPRPRLVLPWQLEQYRRPDLAEMAEHLTYAIDVPPTVAADHLPYYLNDWAQSPPVTFVLHLREPPATRLTHARRVDDLAMRMLYSWEAGTSGLVLSRPWTFTSDRDLMLLPDPLLGVFSSIAQRLAGRRPMGRMPLGDGLLCLIFDGPAGGMLAAWNRFAPEEEAGIDMYLGDSPVAIDVWGNRTRVAFHDRKHHLELDSSPTFIQGIDPQLALFRSTFRIEPPFIESLQIPHQRTITITNPWRRTISGHMIITEPKEWKIEPSRTYLSIASGQTMQVPVTILIPFSEVAGRKELQARFDFVANRGYVVDLFAPMELGLPGVKFDATLSLERNEETGAVDAIVTQLISNTGDEPLNLYAFTNFPGYPRRERIISQLQPAQSILRQFRFPDATDKLRDVKIRVGLRETGGPAILNQVLSTKGSP